jgi:hypothetical protein
VAVNTAFSKARLATLKWPIAIPLSCFCSKISRKTFVTPTFCQETAFRA